MSLRYYKITMLYSNVSTPTYLIILAMSEGQAMRVARESFKDLVVTEVKQVGSEIYIDA